jgi:hypothetical protein
VLELTLALEPHLRVTIAGMLLNGYGVSFFSGNVGWCLGTSIGGLPLPSLRHLHSGRVWSHSNVQMGELAEHFAVLGAQSFDKRRIVKFGFAAGFA